MSDNIKHFLSDGLLIYLIGLSKDDFERSVANLGVIMPVLVALNISVVATSQGDPEDTEVIQHPISSELDTMRAYR